MHSNNAFSARLIIILMFRQQVFQVHNAVFTLCLFEMKNKIQNNNAHHATVY